MKLKIIVLLLLGMTSMHSQTKPIAKKKAPATKIQATPQKTGIFATMETTKGVIVLALEYQKTPVTVANFISLAEGNNPQVSEKFKGKHFYDGLKFHRVIKDFMVQGGDPLGTGSGDPGYKFKDEITDLKHSGPGILSMANSGPATNGSQFFITHKATPWLDGKHTVFGHVIKGMDVVNMIEQNDVILKLSIEKIGNDAKNFDAPKVYADYLANKGGEEKKKEEAETAFKKAAAEKTAIAKAKKKPYLEEVLAKGTTTESGLKYAIVKKGTGVKPTEGTMVNLFYAGYLDDGTLFDSNWEEVSAEYGIIDPSKPNRATFKPISFKTGHKKGMIPGFIEAIELLGFGDKIVAYLPAALAYGERGASNVIPPNANLIFEIELQEKTATSTPNATETQPKK